jgi:hypothetical protein
MVRTLEEVAKNIGYARIYCGTSTAGHLLERRGWQFMKHVIYNGEDVSIYQKAL